MKLVRVELECSKGTVRGIEMLYQRSIQNGWGLLRRGRSKAGLGILGRLESL